MPYEQNKQFKETDWLSKEKRELFCKSVNSLLMDNKMKVDDTLIEAQKIIDKAFELYPDKNEITDDRPL